MLEHFRDKERREEFYGFFRELEDIYEILSPDAFLRPFLPDYDDLVGMFHLVRAYYERGNAGSGVPAQDRHLVQEHTKSGRSKSPRSFMP